MMVNQEKCVGCGVCVPYCPAQAISVQNKKAAVNQELCLECGNCLRTDVVPCPGKAFYELPGIYETPRALRRFFSDPMTIHSVTKVPGRGTEEVKTNDVTGRVCRGEIGIAIELGRPCLGTNMEQLEKVVKALAEFDLEYEPCNPTTELIADKKLGKVDPRYKDERLVSAILEFKTSASMLKPIIEKIKIAAQELDTVFSLDLIGCFDSDGALPVLAGLEQVDIKPRVNSKINLGMGRPYKIVREQSQAS